MITVYSKYRTVYVLHLRGVYTQPNNLETRQFVTRRIFQWRGLTVRAPDNNNEKVISFHEGLS